MDTATSFTDWSGAARALADRIADPYGPWHRAVADVPRHLLVPRWFWRTAPGAATYEVYDGPSNGEQWGEAAYRNQTLITRVGSLHADHATNTDRPAGRPTSSATMPSLVLRMFEHARLHETTNVLDVGTGSGYSTALLCRRLGAARVTSIDVDPYLTRAAAERLDQIGMNPRISTCDATGPLPGSFDRIVSMVGMPAIPATWLEALRPGGRLVTTLAEAPIIVTATKTDDGHAVGQVEWDRAGFMSTRTGPDYPPALTDKIAELADHDGEQVTRSSYPVIDVANAWELQAVFALTHPGIQHHYREDPDGTRTAWMLHPDGSWARATGTHGQPATIHQSGPRFLWDLLDDIRRQWLSDGYLQLYGATVHITPEGTASLTRGHWRATIR